MSPGRVGGVTQSDVADMAVWSIKRIDSRRVPPSFNYHVSFHRDRDTAHADPEVQAQAHPERTQEIHLFYKVQPGR